MALVVDDFHDLPARRKAVAANSKLDNWWMKLKADLVRPRRAK
jgi:hypothetical protein